MAKAHKVAFELDADNRQQARCDQCGVIFTARGLAIRAAAGTVLIVLAWLALAVMAMLYFLGGLSQEAMLLLPSFATLGFVFGLICRDRTTVLMHGQPRPPFSRS